MAAFAVTAFMAPTAAVAAPAPTIQVIPVSRYADGPELDDPATAAQALDATRLARVDVTVAGGPPCPSDGRWRVDGSLYTPSFADVTGVGCRFSLYLAAHAKHRVEVRWPADSDLELGRFHNNHSWATQTQSPREARNLHGGDVMFVSSVGI